MSVVVQIKGNGLKIARPRPAVLRAGVSVSAVADSNVEPALDGMVMESRVQTAQMASISRVFMSGAKPNMRLRSALSHRLTPLTLAVASLYTVTSALRALRSLFIERSRNCKTCRGYSIQRCDVCSGSGTIQWEGKWGHVEPCPRCLGKRYTRCTSCGGWHAHSLFQHVPREASNMEEVLQPISVEEELRQVKHDLALD